MFPERLDSVESWPLLLKALRPTAQEEQRFRYITFEDFADPYSGDVDHSLIIIPFMVDDPELMGMAAVAAESFAPCQCLLFLERVEAEEGGLQAFRVDLKQLEELFHGKVELTPHLEYGKERGLATLLEYLQLLKFFGFDQPAQSSGPILPGAIYDAVEKQVYHVVCLYPQKVSETVEGTEEIGFQAGGKQLAKLSFASQELAGTDSLSRMAIWAVVDNLVEGRKKEREYFKAVRAYLDRIEAVRPELMDEENFNEFVCFFLSPLFRQFSEFLRYSRDRLLIELSDSLSEDSPDEGRFQELQDMAVLIQFFNWFAAPFSLTLYRLVASGKYPLPANIVIDWDLERLSPQELGLAIRWWHELIQPENWQPSLGTGIPAFIFLSGEKDYSSLARIFMGDVQISMFARRIYIPGYFSLSEKQQRSLWDFMAEVYDDLVDLPQKLRVFELFNQYLPAQSRVIDAGCGTGLYGRYAKPQETQLIGIDFSKEMVSRSLAAGVYDEVLHQSLVEPWTVKDKSVNGVLVSFVSHLVDLGRVALEARRVLSPGGVLLVNLYEPQPGWQEKYRNQFEGLGFETVHTFDEQVGEKEIKGLLLRLRPI